MMIFEQVATGGCQSYLVGCAETLSAVVIDPEISRVDRYKALGSMMGRLFLPPLHEEGQTTKP
jgi:hypothetical protein